MKVRDFFYRLFVQPQARKMTRTPSAALKRELEEQREIQEMWRRVTRLKSELSELRVLSPDQDSSEKA